MEMSKNKQKICLWDCCYGLEASLQMHQHFKSILSMTRDALDLLSLQIVDLLQLVLHRLEALQRAVSISGSSK